MLRPINTFAIILVALTMHDCMYFHIRPADDSGLSIPSPLLPGVSDSVFITNVDADLQELKGLFIGLNELLQESKNHPTWFTEPAYGVMPPKDKQELLMFWQSFLDRLYAVETIRLRYCAYWKINYFTQRSAHVAAFSAANSALLELYYFSSHFIRLVNSGKAQTALFDEPFGDVPEGAFSRLKYNTLNFITYTYLTHEDQHFVDWCQKDLDTSKIISFRWAAGFQSAYSDSDFSLAQSGDFIKTFQNAGKLSGQSIFSIWFPIQKGLATWMGHTRLASRKPYITPILADSLGENLQPGDIIFIRKNWYLSNVGLPGFWPHVALYLGTSDEQKAYFDKDSDVLQYVREQSNGTCSTFTSFWKKKMPGNFERFIKPANKDGRRVRTIEALSEGVVFNSLEATCACDYVAAIRPRLSKKEIAIALLYAIDKEGTPYDWDFDFQTDATLVCTELIYKAYQERPGISRGLHYEPVEIAGRMTLPPNNMVSRFKENLGKPNQETDFVGFIDASENKECAFKSDIKAFQESCVRTKWELFLQ